MFSLIGVASLVYAVPLSQMDRYGLTLVNYAEVSRPDGSYRRMLTSPEVIELLQRDQPIPNGARILMETYYTPNEVSTVFHMRKVAGRWQYGSFHGKGTVNLTVRPQASCLSCHANAAETDFVFTHAAIGADHKQGLIHFSCNRAGRSPCDLSVYRIRANN